MLLGVSLALTTLACGTAVLAAPDGPANGAQNGAHDGDAPGAAMIVTSDSSAYCHTLSGAIEAHGALPREVRDLKVEGDGLCNGGHVRGGIARLRRALLALHKETDAGEPAHR